MPFPRSPKKAVKGKLSIMVRSPTTKVEMETAPIGSHGGSDDNVLNFKAPLGFTVEQSFEQTVKKQFTKGKDRIQDIINKSSECVNCHKSNNILMLERSNLLLKKIEGACRSLPEDRFSVVVGQEPNNDITIDIIHGKRQVSFIIDKIVGGIQIGLYSNSILVNEDITTLEIAPVSVEKFFIGGIF